MKPIHQALCIVLTLSSMALAADGDPAVAQAEAPVADTTRRESGFSPVELQIWNDPEFQRRFTESYVGEMDIEPRITLEERKTMVKAMELISAEKIDEAVALLEKARQSPASSAVFEFTLANIAFQREEFSRAQELYTAAVKKYPKFRRAWLNLAKINVRQQNLKDAIPAYVRVFELGGGGDASTYGLMGYAYSLEDNHIAAETAYRMAILLDPKTLDWKMGLARSLFKQERFADAAALTGQLLKEMPNRSELWLLQANALIGLNAPLKAAENYEIVDRMGQSTFESLTTLGDIYVNNELYDVGVDAYIRAMNLKSPKSNPARALRAAKVLTARNAMAETKKLLAHIEQVFGDSITPDNRKDILKLRSRIAVAEGAGDEEARILEEIVKLDPLDGEALILLGQHAQRSEQPDKAMFYYERAAVIEKFEADAKVRQAQLLVTQKKYDAALPLLRSAQQLKPRENVQKYLEQVERIAKAR
jgi:tetratricopeptide (TPR) repeat protein